MGGSKQRRGLSALSLTSSMVIFGTIGLFVSYIPLPSSVIAAVRGLVGAAVLGLFMLVSGKRLDPAALRGKWIYLILSGAAIGVNWIFLFEAYRYTTVAVATLCYYLAPVFFILGAAAVFRERLTLMRLLCVVMALAGMVPVSGVLSSGGGLPDLRGVAFAAGAAVLYASVMLFNKKLSDVDAYGKTLIQLATAGVAVLPYALFADVIPGGGLKNPGTVGFVCLAVVAVVHTGVAYTLYFFSFSGLPAQTCALMAYVDPVVAVIASALIMKQPIDVWQIVGAVLILTAAVLCELFPGKPGKAAPSDAAS